MTTYGYSIWALMIPSQEIMDLLNEHNRVPHIPHITVKTNLTFEEAEDFLFDCITWEDIVDISGKAYVLPTYYDNDPLKGWGFPAQLRKIKSDHVQHLTIKYSTAEIQSCPDKEINISLPVHLRIVDTTSENPSEWAPVTPVII